MLNNSNIRIKILITSRPENGILTNQHLDNIKKYVRLLPFVPDQINYFFERYGVKVGDRLLTDTYATELKLPIEEMKAFVCMDLLFSSSIWWANRAENGVQITLV